jgi:TP901 family phage tail tape measure protein
MATTYTRRITLYINGKEVRNDISSIKKEMNNLVREQSKMTIGSQQYVDHAKKIQQLKGVMAQHNNQLRETRRNWNVLGSAADKFNKYSQMAIGVFAGVVALAMGFKAAAEEANLFEERLDNLSALTGLTGKNLEWLGETAKATSIEITENGIRIKQAASDILDAYTKVGSQRPELLKNKEALHAVAKDAIILSEAAKMELEPAVKGLTTSLNQHNLAASESRRVINAMAAGSKEGAAEIPYLTEALEKSGTTMALMGVSFEENIGLIEAIAPKFAMARIAGTGLDRVFLKMKANQIGYASGIFNVQDALTELETRFKNGESSAELFGTEHAKMAEVLVQARGEVKRYTEAVTGTEIAIEQATINTSNATAKKAQAINRLKLILIEFGEKINPLFLKSTNLVTYLIKGLMATPKFIKENQLLIIALAGALAAYNAALIAAMFSQVKKLALDTREIAANAGIAAIATARVIGMKIYIAITGKATEAQIRFMNAQIAFGKAMALSPWGMAIAAITAVVLAVKGYDKYSAQAIQREKEKALAVSALTEVNTKLSETYNALEVDIKSLNKLGVEEKTALQDKIAKTIELTEAELLLQQAKQNEITGSNTRITAWQGLVNIFKSYGNAAVGMSLNIQDAAINGFEAGKTLQDGIDGITEKIAGMKRQQLDLNEILQAESIADKIGTETMSQMELKLSTYQTALRNVVIGSKDYIRIQEKINKLDTSLNTTRGKSGKITEAQQKILLDALVKTTNEKKSILTKQRADEEITEQQFNDRMDLIELASLESKKALLLNAGEEISEIDLEIANKRLSITNGRIKAETDAEEDAVKTKKAQLDKLKEDYEAVKALFKEDNEISPDGKLGDIEVIQDNLKTALEEELNAVQETEYFKTLAVEEQEAERAGIRKKYQDIFIASVKDQAKLWLDLGSQVGTLMGTMLSDQEITLQEFGKTMLLFALDVLEKQLEISIASATMQSLASPESIATYGIAGIAKAALLTGLIKAAFAYVKGQIANSGKDSKGYYEGGFTKGEGLYKAGEHGQKEWISPGWMVNDPNTGPLIESLENYRQHKTGLNPDIIKNAPTFFKGGYTPSSGNPEPVNQINDSINSELKKLIFANTQTLAKLPEEIRKLKLFVVTELIKKDLDTLSKIQAESKL